MALAFDLFFGRKFASPHLGCLHFFFIQWTLLWIKNWFIHIIGYALLQNLEAWIEVAVIEHHMLALRIFAGGSGPSTFQLLSVRH